MLSIYPLISSKEIERTSPLHVSAFFSLPGMQWKKRKQRQGLILSIALAWWTMSNKHISAPGFAVKDFYLTSLSAQDKESRKVFEYFFNIDQIGFNLGNGTKQPSKIRPKKLPGHMTAAIINFLEDAKFQPEQRPKNINDYTISSVNIKCKDRQSLFRRLVKEGKEHLKLPVEWLLNQEGPIDFFNEPAGSLKARDKSVWPVRNIETWPGWLRKELFGKVVDIENAYMQFVLITLKEKYGEDPKFKLMYPDLIKMDKQKKQFRNDLCVNYFKLEPTKENIKFIKNVLMSLSNGSRISGKMVQTFNTNSDAVKIILEANRNLTTEEMFAVGERLSTISKQLKSAKKDICRSLGMKGTIEDQKIVFQLYMQWERNARHKIWKCVNQTGLHMHDGLDGIESPLSSAQLKKKIEKETGIRVSVEEPEYD